jgi:predicted regulator of Ras-like GTPase activity (Roadblock/LC7/MglB family)
MDISELFPWEFIKGAQSKTKALIESDSDIDAAVLATTDGFSVASAIGNGADPDRIAALASSISTIGAIATQEAGLGRCSSVILNTDNGFAVVRQFSHHNKDLVLIAVANGKAMLAKVMYQANHFVKAVVDV